MHKEQITLAITGASGARYGIRLLQWLNKADFFTHVLFSEAGRLVLSMEEGLELPKNPAKQKALLVSELGLNGDLIACWSNTNWKSPVASGSSAPSRMVVCPCSTGSLSAIATGASNNLIERGADVVLKEQGNLIVVPRETPYSLIHIENMRSLVQTGAVVLPASPGFYNNPDSIEELVDFVVSRILDKLHIENDLSNRWGYEQGKEVKEEAE